MEMPQTRSCAWRTGRAGIRVRLACDISEPDYLSTSMEMSQDGEAWNRFFDARLKRQ